MTTVEVSSYDDLRGDAVSTAGEKDAILDALDDADGTMRAFRAESWLWEDKDLETSPRHDTLVYGHIVAETEDALLVSQLSTTEHPGPDASDPQTDWVPKSVVRIYKPGEDGVNPDTTPQSFLKEWENDG